jgi:hypothetical protein
MVIDAYNLSTWKLRQEDHDFKASMDHNCETLSQKRRERGKGRREEKKINWGFSFSFGNGFPLFMKKDVEDEAGSGALNCVLP